MLNFDIIFVNFTVNAAYSFTTGWQLGVVVACWSHSINVVAPCRPQVSTEMSDHTGLSYVRTLVFNQMEISTWLAKFIILSTNSSVLMCRVYTRYLPS